MTTSTVKVGGVWAGCAALVAALGTAVVQVRPVLNDLALAESGKIELEEIRRHAIDKPVEFHIVGTSRGVVQFSVFETGCVRVASANRLRSLPAPEHEIAEAKQGANVLGAGVPVNLASSCWQTPDGQCRIPADHPTWDVTESHGDLPDGALLMHLVWHHGCRLEAKFYPASGMFVYLRWLACCNH